MFEPLQQNRDPQDQPPALKLDVRPDPHVMDYLIMVAKHKWVVILCVVAGGLVGYWLPSQVPWQFDARSLMLPPDRASSSDLLNKFNAGGAMKMLKMVENPSVDLLENIAESRGVCRRVAQDSMIAAYYNRYVRPEGKYDDPAVWIRGSTDCEAGFSRMAIHTMLETAPKPTETEKNDCRFVAAQISNVTVAVVNEWVDSMMNQEAHVRRAKAESELALRTTELDSLSRTISNFESSHHIAALDAQISASVDLQAGLQAAVVEAEEKQRLESADMTSDAIGTQSAALQVEEAKRALESYQMNGAIGSSFSKLPFVQQEYANLKIRLRSLEPVMTYLRQEVEQEKINEERNRSPMQLLDAAEVPTRKVAPQRLIYLLTGLTVGIALAFFYVSMRAFISSARRYRAQYIPEPALVEAGGL